MAAVGYAERERMRQEQGEGSFSYSLEGDLSRWLLHDAVFNYQTQTYSILASGITEWLWRSGFILIF